MVLDIPTHMLIFHLKGLTHLDNMIPLLVHLVSYHALGLSYDPTNSVTLLSNLSTGFRAPNISDFSEVGIRRNNQFQTPSTDLRPETTRNRFGNND